MHLALDADSGEIIAYVMTDQDTGDASQVEPLLDQIEAPIGQFTANGAYDGNPTYAAITRHSCDAAVVIPPRSNAVDRSDTETACQRDRHIAAINTDGRMKWQATTGYGKAFSRRDHNRSLPIDLRTPLTCAIISSATGRDRHRLRRP